MGPGAQTWAWGPKFGPRVENIKLCAENHAECSGRYSKRSHMLQVMTENQMWSWGPIGDSPWGFGDSLLGFPMGNPHGESPWGTPHGECPWGFPMGIPYGGFPWGIPMGNPPWGFPMGNPHGDSPGGFPMGIPHGGFPMGDSPLGQRPPSPLPKGPLGPLGPWALWTLWALWAPWALWAQGALGPFGAHFIVHGRSPLWANGTGEGNSHLRTAVYCRARTSGTTTYSFRL